MSNEFQHRLLVVSSSIYPKRSGSAIVMENLAEHFQSNELLMVGELGPFDKTPQSDGRKHRYRYFRSRFSFFGRGARFFDSIRWRLLPRLQRWIQNHAVEFNANAIMGVYPSELYCIAACRAASELKLPFFSYFHNTYADNTAMDRKRADQLQSEIFDNSQHVFTMSDGMLAHFEECYPGQADFVTLPHTYQSAPPAELTQHQYETPTKVVLFGNFNESNIEATLRLTKTLTNQSDRYEIDLYSDVPEVLLRQRGLDFRKIQHRGSLSHLAFDAMIAKLREYDLLALTHGFVGGYGEIEYKTIFPTRTIPMLLSGRPILLHSPPHSFLTSFFKRFEAGAVADEPTEDSVLRAAAEMDVSEVREKCTQNAIRAAEQFEGSINARKLRQKIKDAASTAKTN